MSTQETVFDFVAKSYKLDSAEGLTPETTFESCGKESMKMIGLLAMIENELDVEVPLRDGMNMKTLGELVERVESEL